MRSILKITFLALFLILAGCKIGERVSFAKEKVTNIHAHVGKIIIITLKSNITTGFSWRLVKPIDKKILKFVGSKYIPDPGKLIGAGGKERWIFKVVGNGNAVIELEYVRPWEKRARVADKRKFNILSIEEKKYTK